MSNAIKVEGVSKRYVIPYSGSSGGGLRHAIEDGVRSIFQRKGTGSLRSEEFWALNDVSFEVKQGEVLGVIGRNGAGKSTLLKILSRITEPTRGRVTIEGRVASLLEVGTGFHPELTGRENIYLNGAILGMVRKEIKSKFDEIVAFAEVERFLETPVKRYSSGMYVRLAFAVAAHLEPEILIVDEVLAVGDTQFQKKCLGKMEEVSRQGGRTVLFVSHNMGAVSALTTQALYLKNGRLEQIGPTSEIVSAYLGEGGSGQGAAKWRCKREDTRPVQVLALSVAGAGAGSADEIEAADEITFEMEYVVREAAQGILIEIYILTAEGVHLITLGEHDARPEMLDLRQPGLYRARVAFPGGLLGLGRYTAVFNVGRIHGETYEHREVLRFSLVENTRRTAKQNRRGALVPLSPWNTERITK